MAKGAKCPHDPETLRSAQLLDDEIEVFTLMRSEGRCPGCSLAYQDEYRRRVEARRDPEAAEDWWAVAVRQRAAEAEARFERGEPLTEADTIAVALAHPEDYEIMVRERVERDGD